MIETVNEDLNPSRADEPLTAAAGRHAHPLFEHADELRITLPFGFLALIAGVISLSICYASNVTKVVFGSGLPLNPHFQAVLMWLFALIAIFALWRDRQRHKSLVPLGLGTVGAAILIGTLYLKYDSRVEAIAYALLVVAALVNQNMFLGVLNRTVSTQAEEIHTLNNTLQKRVDYQTSEIDRLGRLKHFLAPQIADLVVADEEHQLLESHRRYIACLFCDIRNFTAMSDAAEPEDTIAVLQSFHDRIGQLVLDHKATIGFRAGDGLMVFFNDPIPCKQPVLDAVRLALAIREAFGPFRDTRTSTDEPIGIGVGIASGFATLGLIGFHGGADYTAIGRAVNTAARLCDRAEDGQILISERAWRDVNEQVEAISFGQLELKGLRAPVAAWNVTSLKQTEKPVG